MTLPNFLIIGAERCGTTSTYNYLSQHPQVFVTPQKETRFFQAVGDVTQYKGPGDQRVQRQSITRFADYTAQFDRVAEETALGEVCPSYLIAPAAIPKIKRHVPGVRLFAIFRHPVARAYSSFMLFRRMGRETETDFSTALRLGTGRVSQGWNDYWDYRRCSLYTDRLAPYLKAFGRDRITILFYDDLARDPTAFMRRLFRLLDVDDSFEPDVSRVFNPAGIPKNNRLHQLIKHPSGIKKIYRALVPGSLHNRIAPRVEMQNLRREDLPIEIKQSLTGEFRESILRLQDLTARDLSGWLEPPFVAARAH
ncbi:MAG: sulfotransferase family protein [Alphaproteobacteria bacterium]